MKTLTSLTEFSRKAKLLQNFAIFTLIVVLGFSFAACSNPVSPSFSSSQTGQQPGGPTNPENPGDQGENDQNGDNPEITIPCPDGDDCEGKDCLIPGCPNGDKGENGQNGDGPGITIPCPGGDDCEGKDCLIPGCPEGGITEGGKDGPCIHVWSDWRRVGQYPVLQTSRNCTVTWCSEQQTFYGGSHVQASPINNLPAGMLEKEMALIPAGSIMEITQSRDFWMSRHQITRAQWYAIMKTKPWENHWGVGTNDIAVTHINWFDAIEFANRLSIARGLTPVYSIPHIEGGIPTTNPDNWGNAPTSNSGADFNRWVQVQVSAEANGYRLPTSEQWEYAVRAGTRTHFNDGTGGYSLTEDLAAIALIAWTNANSSNRVQEVGQLRPNAWGLHDMHGNVWEWCWDANGDNRANRVTRGGAYDIVARNARSSAWYTGIPFLRLYNNGFRLVRY